MTDQDQMRERVAEHFSGIWSSPEPRELDEIAAFAQQEVERATRQVTCEALGQHQVCDHKIDELYEIAEENERLGAALKAAEQRAEKLREALTAIAYECDHEEGMLGCGPFCILCIAERALAPQPTEEK